MEGRGNPTSGIGCHVCGLVLARGGSVRVPRKNVRSIAGLPLLAWVLHPMLDCKRLTSVWVSTDDTEIAEVALRYGAQVHYRDKRTAKDSSSSLAGVQDFLVKHPDISVIALVQCTSPCLLPMYLDKACEMVLDHNYDSAFSVVRQKKLRWKEVKTGQSTEPLNFNPRQRPRSQDWDGELVESGHFYVSRASLIRDNLLQGKRCGYVEMPEELCIEIDTETDFIIAEKLLELYGYRKNVNELKEYYV